MDGIQKSSNIPRIAQTPSPPVSKASAPTLPHEQIASALDVDPVLNDETRQMMAFDPSRGEVLVWANF